jgi:hypothetical protein
MLDQWYKTTSNIEPPLHSQRQNCNVSTVSSKEVALIEHRQARP